MTTKLWDLKVGDPLKVEDRHWGVYKERVTRVGSKWLYIGKQKYNRETGHADDEYGSRRAYTLSQWDHIEEVRKAREELLNEHGMSIDRRISDEKLLVIHTAVMSAFKEPKE